jgi:hypothetical protein
MTGEHDEQADMQHLAYLDLDAAMDRLYVASKRFAICYEAAMVPGDEVVNIGEARTLLSDAVKASDEAFTRYVATGALDGIDDGD